MAKAAMAEWANGLAGMTGEQIRCGLDTWGEPWPPSLPEFRKACKGKDDWQHRTAAYKPFPRALPKPKADADKARAEIEKMRQCLGQRS